MSISDNRRLWREFSANPPTDLQTIQKFEADANIRLPEDYLHFLLRMNGGYGFVGNTYIGLWPVEELQKMNHGYGVTENVPGLFIFGSDGGGEAAGFDLRFGTNDVICIPFVTLDWADAHRIAPTFTTFLEKVAQDGSWFGLDESQ
jgi:cell wall assembly regulator SMI1